MSRRSGLAGWLGHLFKMALPGRLPQQHGSERPPGAHHPRQEGYGAGTAVRSARTRGITLEHLSGSWGVIGDIPLLAAILAVPVAMGVAILRYRRYDIDRIISRTLAYAIITGLLVGVYAGIVQQALEPAHVSVWMNGERGETR